MKRGARRAYGAGIRPREAKWPSATSPRTRPEHGGVRADPGSPRGTGPVPPEGARLVLAGHEPRSPRDHRMGLPRRARLLLRGAARVRRTSRRDSPSDASTHTDFEVDMLVAGDLTGMPEGGGRGWRVTPVGGSRIGMRRVGAGLTPAPPRPPEMPARIRPFRVASRRRWSRSLNSSRDTPERGGCGS